MRGPRSAPNRVRSALALLAVVPLAGCAADFYEVYAAEHPDWAPALPEAPAGVRELVASLHAPERAQKARVRLERVEVFEVDGDAWRRVPLDDLRGARGAADYAVIARLTCQGTTRATAGSRAYVAYYLLRAGQVVAYDHLEYAEGCAIRDRFRAARGETLVHERAVNEYIREEYGRRHLAVSQVYRRGLGYVEAGRLQEAQAMLEAGERGYRAAERARRREEDAAPKRGEADPLEEVRRLRERLHRALGVEAERP